MRPLVGSRAAQGHSWESRCGAQSRRARRLGRTPMQPPTRPFPPTWPQAAAACESSQNPEALSPKRLTAPLAGGGPAGARALWVPGGSLAMAHPGPALRHCQPTPFIPAAEIGPPVEGVASWVTNARHSWGSSLQSPT